MTGPPSWIHAVVEHSAGCTATSSFLTVSALLPSGAMKPSAPGCWSLRSCIPTAYALTYLRIANAVARYGARLASGLPDFALAGQGSNLLGGYSTFQGDPRFPLPYGPDFTGRFHRSSSLFSS